ncbi:uncharacterized protein A4U43_C07F25860 [Asparagus officinalis]|uniref:Uncharacterized protein n=1 Tax=Asparagus officinalis TaxID=4686 RepID=A0A5P1EIB8_ASPOF|nr:uncharacterized protein A4U43_C07F25860 [Asparagus officinalis]
MGSPLLDYATRDVIPEQLHTVMLAMQDSVRGKCSREPQLKSLLDGIKVNTDATRVIDTGMVGVAGILRDFRRSMTSRLLSSLVDYIHFDSGAWSYGRKQAVVESDALEAVNLIHKEGRELRSIVGDIETYRHVS